MGKILVGKGQTAKVGQVIGHIEEGAAAKPSAKPAEKPAMKSAPAGSAAAQGPIMPAAARVLAEQGIAAADVKATGPGNRLLKEDVERHAEAKSQAAGSTASASPAGAPSAPGDRSEEAVPMSMLRKKVAERLVSAHQNAALLTTFNEIDMSAAMELRKRHQEAFVKRYGTKLGFMSFFVKAAVDALKLVPQINAEIRGESIVYKHYYDIGVAVGGGKGLVVPVIRNAERLGFAQVELAIADFGKRAQANSLKLEELQGDTFTISNGGVYGSLLSTPIVNPPQSGVLGLHAIQDRPVARDGQVVIRPMMYVALTYDHRIVDGREAVTFLKRIKDTLEDPARILLEI
jgi:2-oxoglutarate dehydrogenase E2 component (dihydrolipoamide succinyltransferase)